MSKKDDSKASITSSGFEKNLKEFLERAKNAKNTLEYSLFLPKIQPVLHPASDDSIISDIIVQCLRNCHCNLFRAMQYKFFSVQCLDKDSHIPDIFYEFKPAYSENYTYDDIWKSDFFASTLMSQCIMSSYDMVLHLLPFEKISPYTLNKFKNNGFYKLNQSNLINTQSFTYPQISLNASGNTSAEASTLYQKIISHLEDWKKGFLRDFSDIGTNGYIDLYSADILYNVTQINASSFHKFSNLYTNFDYNNSPRQNWNFFCKMYRQLEYPSYHDLKNDNNTPIADKLHYYYRLENIFALELCYTFYQSINLLRNENTTYPDGINNLKTIAAISRFPNVFSRDNYLQYAFSFIRQNLSAHKSYFLDAPPATNIVNFIENDKFDFNEWNIVFEKFCLFFNNLIFPAEEWYFFLTLYNTVKYHFSDKACCPKSILLKMANLLSTYINKNYEYITMYWKCPCISDNTPQEYQYTNDNPDISKLLSMFKTINQNTPLSLPYFDRENIITYNDNSNINYKNILKLYTKILTS